MSYKFHIIVFLCVCFLLMVTGCSKRDNISPPPFDLSDIPEPVSQKLTVRVFIDASGSMEGYVVPGSSTNYAQIFPCLESAVLRGWRDGKVEFYKFGTDIIPLKGREHLNACTCAFYQDPRVNRETYIQKVIEYKGTNDGLTVIVSDLFQDQSDVALLVGKLKDKYIQKGLAIGVLGLRSQYDGIVSEVGVGGFSFPYRSGRTQETYRPFYVLMLGRHADVTHYFEKLKSYRLPFVQDTNFVIFSRYLVNELPPFQGASEDLVNIQEWTTLVPSVSRHKHSKQFRIIDKNKAAAFSATLRYNPQLYTMDFDPKKFEVEFTAKRCQGATLMEDGDARLIFSIDSIELSDADLRFSASIKPAPLSTKYIYLYEVVICPEASAYQPPIWFSKWDMGVIQDGSKTINLNRFLSDLWQMTVQVHKPKIARFYCYVKKG